MELRVPKVSSALSYWLPAHPHPPLPHLSLTAPSQSAFPSASSLLVLLSPLSLLWNLL